jgi:hypothetical protein
MLDTSRKRDNGECGDYYAQRKQAAAKDMR